MIEIFLFVLAASLGIINTLLLGGVNKYFKRKRPLAGTLSSTGSSLGGLVMPVFMAYLLQWHGYTQTLIIIAGLWLHGCLVGVILRTPPVPPNPGPNVTSDEIQTPTEEIRYDAKTEHSDAEQQNVEEKHSVEFKNNSRKNDQPTPDNASSLCRYSFLRNPQVVRYLLAAFLGALAYFNWFIYLPLFTRHVGLTTTQTSLCISLSSLADGIVRPIVGAILTKKNHPPDKPLVCAIFCFLAGLLTLAICLASSTWVFLIYGAVNGAVDGIFMGLSVPMMADHIHLTQIGTLAGIYAMSIALGVGIGTPLIGKFYFYCLILIQEAWTFVETSSFFIMEDRPYTYCRCV